MGMAPNGQIITSQLQPMVSFATVKEHLMSAWRLPRCPCACCNCYIVASVKITLRALSKLNFPMQNFSHVGNFVAIFYDFKFNSLLCRISHDFRIDQQLKLSSRAFTDNFNLFSWFFLLFLFWTFLKAANAYITGVPTSNPYNPYTFAPGQLVLGPDPGTTVSSPMTPCVPQPVQMQQQQKLPRSDRIEVSLPPSFILI